MYVCLCRAVTDRAVKGAVGEGARTFREIARKCGAGTGCGGCRRAVEAVASTTLGGTDPFGLGSASLVAREQEAACVATSASSMA